MKNLAFNKKLARDYGINESIVLSQIAYWIYKNKMKDINFRKGKTWTFNSVKNWAKELESFSANQISYALASLKKQGVLLADNFNKYKCNRTLWYSIVNETAILKLLGYENKARQSLPCIEWRKAIFSRDNFTCQKCGAKDSTIQAHHIKPWKDNPDARLDLNNGITLCLKCHKQIHPWM